MSTDIAIEERIGQALAAVHKAHPLVHCITNYVTVNDCANALLAIDASPIMSDEPDDAVDITAICDALDINIGTLNRATIAGMEAAAARASQLGHPLVLDPVGAGASALRTQEAAALLDAFPIAVIRGNMSECKALAVGARSTHGVDVAAADVVTDTNLAESAGFARQLAAMTGAVAAITGAIDVVASADEAYAVRNGSPMQGRITGAGCMLSAITGAFVAANDDPLLAALAAVVTMGAAGQIAEARMGAADGNASFRTYLIDALYTLEPEQLARMARVERIER